jgi:protein arginine kinase activator
MKCQLCQERDATVHVRQVEEGVEREVHVCAECAAQHGFEGLSPMDLTDFLFGVGSQTTERRTPADDKRCAVCGLTGKDFKKLSRLGCASCHDSFADDLRELLSSMHVGDQHVGKVPAAERSRYEIGRIRQEMAEAIQRQDFETAARCRDRLREITAAEATAAKDSPA